MAIKKILGLDIGTNSIGWALIECEDNHLDRIVKLGSRIVPMDGAEVSDFRQGLPQTRNAQRRLKKGARVGNKRYKQRRNKLLYVLQRLGMLPDQIRLSSPFDDPHKIQRVNILPVEKQTKQLTSKAFLALKVKAIRGPLSAKDFGRILYHFNQLRGYSGGDDSENQDEVNNVLGIISDKKYPANEIKIGNFRIVAFRETEEMKTVSKKKKQVFEVEVDGGDGQIQSGTTLIEGLSVGESIEMKQTIRRNSKTGIVSSMEFSIPNKSGWRKKMENLEDALELHAKKVGRKTYISEYFLERVEENEWYKVRDNVILRSRYMEEFDAIWEQQYNNHIKNVAPDVIEEIAKFLFPGASLTQKKFREDAINGGLKHIIRDQIIYFQRPLKDQSYLIADCRFEVGEKAVPKSHPLFQEYKVWEQLNKLSINKRLQIGTRKNGTPKYQYQDRSISSSLKEHLFEELQSKQKLGFKTVYAKLFKYESFQKDSEFFNGLGEKAELVGNATRLLLKKKMGRFWDVLELDMIGNQIELWDILYNGKGNEYDLDSKRNKRLISYLKTKGVEEAAFDQIVIAISCIKFPRDYASVSLKTVQKALVLMRAGKFFDPANFSQNIKERIGYLYNENVVDPYDTSLQNYLENIGASALEEGGFINAYALMLLYGQHTVKEIAENQLLEEYSDLKPLARHSLRNPLVEQMLNETLMVVKDIWKQYGKPDEIRIELARDLKNSQKERKKIHDANVEGKKTNRRIKNRLSELKQELSAGNIEKYKLWEGQVNKEPEYVERYDTTNSEVEKMRLWEEQGHIDPYTGRPIPLSALFDKGLYDVDHVIPKSRYFDDSLDNKVVCATIVNKDKGNRTAMEYLDAGSTKCELLTKERFMENAVAKFFGKKRRHMLATQIPTDPIERQKKETQYITIKAKEELAKIVGSSHIKVSSGQVTHYLRNHWGVTNVFKELLEERFERYFRIKATKEFHGFEDHEGAIVDFLKKLADEKLPENQKQSFLARLNQLGMPISEKAFVELYVSGHNYFHQGNKIIKGYSKRYDHRHHAMDALVVACTDEKAVKRLNDLNKHLQDWVTLQVKNAKINLPEEQGEESLLDLFLLQENDIRDKAMVEIQRFRDIPLPWSNFLSDMKHAMEDIIVSHKPKDKLLIQNKEEKDESGNLVKTDQKTIRIRSALHDETIYGLSGGYESYRIPLKKFAGSNFDTAGNIDKIINGNLKKLIKDHFENTYGNDKVAAFGAEGLLALNKKLAEKTTIKNGVEVPAPHPAIDTVKVYRKKIKEGAKYTITLQKLDREKSHNDRLYVNTANNYLYCVLEKDGERIYDIISLYNAVELLKEAFRKTENKEVFDKKLFFENYFQDKNKARVLFLLKQIDMVYLPQDGEEVILDDSSALFQSYWKSKERVGNIWTVTKFSGKQIYFLNHTTAEVIEKKVEFDSQNQLEFVAGRKIIEHCWPISLDRLGNIEKVHTSVIL